MAYFADNTIIYSYFDNEGVAQRAAVNEAGDAVTISATAEGAISSLLGTFDTLPDLVIGDYAFDVMTNGVRRADLREGATSRETILTRWSGTTGFQQMITWGVNLAHTQFYALVLDSTFVNDMELVRWDLPDFTNRTVVATSAFDDRPAVLDAGTYSPTGVFSRIGVGTEEVVFQLYWFDFASNMLVRGVVAYAFDGSDANLIERAVWERPESAGNLGAFERYYHSSNVASPLANQAPFATELGRDTLIFETVGETSLGDLAQLGLATLLSAPFGSPPPVPIRVMTGGEWAAAAPVSSGQEFHVARMDPTLIDLDAGLVGSVSSIDITVTEFIDTFLWVLGAPPPPAPEPHGAALVETNPHAPTWEHPLNIVRSPLNATTLSWRNNFAFPGQTQAAYRLRRQMKDGSQAQWRSMTGTWENASQVITSTTPNVVLPVGFQADATTLDYLVAIEDGDGRLSPFSSPLRLTTSTTALSVLTITSPAMGQTIGQLPVVTWEVDQQVAFELRVQSAANATLWSEARQEGDDRRATLFVPASAQGTTVTLGVRVTDSAGRVSPWAEVDCPVSFTPRTAPAFTIATTTDGANAIGLTTADADITHVTIQRRIDPPGRANARRRGVLIPERTRTATIAELDDAPIAGTSPFLDYQARVAVAYDYRLVVTWDDETRVTTGWEG